MEKTLGLDLGTNSIGWAVILRTFNNIELLEKGVLLFQEGIKIEKGIESSKASERTTFRLLRRHYFRRRLRKAETLKVLSELGLCPYVSKKELKLWVNQGTYPLSEEMINWQRTDDHLNKNPYRCRFEAIDRILDLSNENDRFLLGRAFYHITQRRGFLSNRLEGTKESEGEVKKDIKDLNQLIQENNCRTLGEYFYTCYKKQRIRGIHTSRIAHYEAEFYAICNKQQLTEETISKLHRAIFYQRPLKSQKEMIGRCSFERNKARCPISHPRFEYYRLLCFINNIKIKTLLDESLRPLNNLEKTTIIPLFYRKKESFKFEDIASKLAGKNRYAYYKDRGEKTYLFNYKMNTTVSGCPFSAELKGLLGEQWETTLYDNYTLKGNKDIQQVVNDIWHVLFSFDDEQKVIEFAESRLNLTHEEAEKFAKIKPQQGYASLSIKAINKITPFLEQGLIYSHAVFLANMGSVVPKYIWSNEENRAIIIEGVVNEIDNYDYRCGKTLSQNIINFLRDNFELASDAESRLYHPSMIENYKASNNGLLGSPRTNAVRNPMAMRTLFQLRRLINKLLIEGIIDQTTKINIEMSRSLNNANMRKAIEQTQREEASRREAIKKCIQDLTNGAISNPTDTDILKYKLWEEQNHICIYTGDEISPVEFLNANPKYDIEHTIPRSMGGDNSQMNKTLANSNYNRSIKGAKMPTEMANFELIRERIASWNNHIIDLEEQLQKNKRRKSFNTKEEKDFHIVKRNKIIINLNYWRGKYERFTTEKYNQGFRNSQGVDAGIISKYARLYLKSLFPKVYTVKGEMTAEFRKLWGLQNDYVKKERANHVHHCTDAITIACIDKQSNDEYSAYYRRVELYEKYKGNKPHFPKPWPTFTEEVKAIDDELLIVHYTPDTLGKNTKKRKRVRGKIVEGIYLQGDTARGSLHQDTYYGAIHIDGQLNYVIRKRIDTLKDTDVKNIVDPVVREKVEQAIQAVGFKQAMASTIWMNEEKQISIKKVRCLTPTVKNPFHIRMQRDRSDHDYKQQFHVVNDGNYVMAIYEGLDKNGKLKRSFEIKSNMDAARILKHSSKSTQQLLFPIFKNQLPFKHALKTGTLVLFWETTPDEIWQLNKKELKKRLYKVLEMEKGGRITFRFHQEARNDEMLKQAFKNEFQEEAPKSLTKGVSSIDFNHPASKVRLSPSSFNMLVEGYNFEIDVLGRIKPL